MKENKRTFKRRIFFSVSLCIFLTVVVFASIMIYMTAWLTREQANLISTVVCYNIAREMNAEYFLNRMAIEGLEEFNADLPAAQGWFENIDINDIFLAELEKEVHTEDKDTLIADKIHRKNRLKASSNVLSKINLLYINIEINSELIFTTNDGQKGFIPAKFLDEGQGLLAGLVRNILSFYSDLESSYPLYNTAGQEIGQVKTLINPEIILLIFLFFLTLPIIICGIVSMIISIFLSKILVYPISKPLGQLEQKMQAIAQEDYQAGKDMKVVLKRPLREVESIAISTNQIIDNMNTYSNVLSEQKTELEEKNQELENQNEELEAQKEEIEAQNEALAESKSKLEDAQTQLVQSEKMASVGQLTAAIAHEINTPLGAINSNVQMLDVLIAAIKQLELIYSNQEVKELIQQMEKANNVNLLACARVTDIIKSLKQFSSLDQAEYQEANLRDCLQSVLVLTSNLWKNKVTIHEDYGQIPMVKCFSGLLNQVFMNVIVNSIYAIEDKGNIYIKTEQQGGNVIITIKDDGSGISKENLARIFEYGFTTKKNGKGMGVGLAISHNIIEKHQGEIVVNSEDGMGTEIIIKIPVDKTI